MIRKRGRGRPLGEVLSLDTVNSALERLRVVMAREPVPLPPLESVERQLEYLRDVLDGSARPDRLDRIVLTVYAFREVEPLDAELAARIGDIAEAVRQATGALDLP